MTISASLVAKDNGSLAMAPDTHLYRFHWIHTPLMLTGKMEKDLTSTIRLVGHLPGDFPVSVWVTATDCWMCQPVTRSFTVVSITGTGAAVPLAGLPQTAQCSREHSAYRESREGK